MNNRLIIAESGGTKTDWVWLEDGTECNRITTGSYHPNRINDEWIAAEKEFWNAIPEISSYTLHFYGSGCLSEQRAAFLKEVLTRIGFNVELVVSDLHAAGKAIWGDETGWVAILGTGSVLAYYSKGVIKEVVGGFGYLLGDEGGGYHFGKLLVQNFLNAKESNELEMKENLGCANRSELLTKVYSSSGKEFLSNLAKDNAERYEDISRYNLQCFADRYLIETSTDKRIGVVGTYGYSQKKLVQTIFTEKGWELHNFVDRPMDELLKCYVKRSV